MKPEMENVILGTAQFGLHYGVSNNTGKTEKKDVKKILSRAYELGVRELDTAPAYGDSEKVLSEVMLDCFKVNTKLLAIGGSDKIKVINTLNQSINLLGNTINSVAVHDISDASSSDFKYIIEEINSLKKKGVIEKFGFSIYNVEDLEIVRLFNPDFIQLPFNVYDQRFSKQPMIDELRFNGCEIHVRSVFLQGLLLMSVDEIPDPLKSIEENVISLNDYSIKNNSSIYELCLSWVLNQSWVDKVVIGINDINQLEAIEKTIKSIIKSEASFDLSKFRIDDESIVNPAKWS